MVSDFHCKKAKLEEFAAQKGSTQPEEVNVDTQTFPPHVIYVHEREPASYFPGGAFPPTLSSPSAGQVYCETGGEAAGEEGGGAIGTKKLPIDI